MYKLQEIIYYLKMYRMQREKSFRETKEIDLQLKNHNIKL